MLDIEMMLSFSAPDTENHYETIVIFNILAIFFAFYLSGYINLK
jgi:hypothetical protein